jgi:hypothetical protein
MIPLFIQIAFTKHLPKLWKETLITQDSIKTQVIPKKYVKIAKNQIQNLQKNAEIFFVNSFSKDLKLSKFLLNMRKFSPIFTKYFCDLITI